MRPLLALLLTVTGCFLPPNETLLGGFVDPDASYSSCSDLCAAAAPQLQRDFGIGDPGCDRAVFAQATTCAACRAAFVSSFNAQPVAGCEGVLESVGGTGGGSAMGGGSATGGGSAVGGGSASGGGSAMGGGTATGGTGAPPDGGGIIPKLPRLTDTECRWTAPAASCPDDAGTPCLLLHRDGVPPVRIATDGVLGGVVIAEGGVFQASAAPGNPSLWVAPLDGGARTLLWTSGLPGPQPQLELRSVAASPAGTWLVMYVAGEGQRLLLAGGAPGALGFAATAALNLPSVWAASATGAAVLLAHSDGLYRYDATTSAQLEVRQRIQAVVAQGAEVYFTACDTFQNVGPCTLWRRSGALAAVPLFTVDDLLGSLVVRPEAAYVLGNQALYRVPRAGGPTERLYAGEPFPQYAGTLRQASLRADGDKLYLSQVCHFDADAPEYGTVELDLALGSARWLNRAPGFPFLPWVQPRETFPTESFQRVPGAARGCSAGLLVWH